MFVFVCTRSTSASLEPSYVLRALGAEEDMAHSSIRCQYLFLQEELSKINWPPSQKTFYWLTSFVRFGIGRFTSEDEVWNSYLTCFFYFIIFATLHRWGTLWRGLWRRSTDWERCLPSGTWFRLTHHPFSSSLCIHVSIINAIHHQDGIDLKTIQWTQHWLQKILHLASLFCNHGLFHIALCTVPLYKIHTVR